MYDALRPTRGCLDHFLIQDGGRSLLLFRRQHDDHALALELRHLLHFAIFLKVVGKTQQQHFALLLEENRTAFEKHIGFHLGAFLKETDRVFELEVVVVVVGLRAETNLLHHHLRSLGFDLLGLFLLLIEIFLIVENLAHRRFHLRGDFHQIEFQLLSYLMCLLDGIYTRRDASPHKAYITGAGGVGEIIGRVGVVGGGVV